MAWRSTKDLAVRGVWQGDCYSEALGWTEQQINALSNLRPECRQCSHRTGGAGGESREACDASAVAANRCCFPA